MAGKALKSANGKTGFHPGGFALGFPFGLIVALIAYLIRDDKKRNGRKWAWIGLVVYVCCMLSFSLTSFSADADRGNWNKFEGTMG
jgi:multisubunit Na+/H+ antiporter MnhE subunit